MHDEPQQEAGAGAGHRAARPGRHPAARAQRVDDVPARVLRRHAPAGDDRHGDRQRPRRCSSPTSRPPRSTSRSRRRCSRCSSASRTRIDSAIMLITHDLGVVAGVADRVMVMYAGRQVELGDRRRDLLRAAAPVHARAAGVAAARRRQPATSTLHRIEGQPPSLINLPPGCPFHPRCPLRPGRRAATPMPPLRRRRAVEHLAACRYGTSVARVARRPRRPRRRPRTRRDEP